MTSKKLLSALMALVFALSLFTALPVSAADYSFTQTSVADGSTISAATTLIFKTSPAIAAAANVKLYKLADDGTTWEAVSFTGSFSSGKYTAALTGKVYPASDYKFEFELDAANAGAELSFAFKTAPLYKTILVSKESVEVPENGIVSAADLPLTWSLEKKVSDSDVTLYTQNASGEWQVADKTGVATLNAAGRTVSLNNLAAGVAYKIEAEYDSTHEGADTTSIFHVANASVPAVVDNNDETVANGGTIEAAEILTITLPAAISEASDVTLYEYSKASTKVFLDNGILAPATYYPIFARNVDATPNQDGTITVEFERGDISSNSTYKLEFDTDSTTVGREYAFNFATKAEVTATGETVYYAENFERYKSNAANDLDMGGYNAMGTHPHNLAPVLKGRGWTGGTGGGNTKIMTYEEKEVMKIFANGTKFINLGTHPDYSAPLSGLSHTGETTVKFKLANISKWADFSGITLNASADDATAIDVYVEKVTPYLGTYGSSKNKNMTSSGKNVNGDAVFTTGEGSQSASDGTITVTHEKIGTRTYTTADEAKGWHTIQYVTTTNYVANGASYTKLLLQVKLDGVVVWQTNGLNAISMPANSHGSASGGGVTGFSKAVPALPSNVTQVDYVALWSAAGSTSLYVDYAEYKDFPVQALSMTGKPDVSSPISPVGTLSFTFNDVVNKASLATGLTFEEEDKRSAGTWIARNLPPYDLKANDKNTVEVTFAEGFLSPNSKYRLTFGTNITSAMGGALTKAEQIEFTTSWDDKYYINDNFSRYKQGHYAYGSTVKAKPETAVMPWGKMYGNSSAWVWNHYIIDTGNGEQAQQMVIGPTYTGYGYLGYYNAYAAPVAAGAAEHKGVYEFDFDIAGTENNIFELGEIVLAKDRSEAGVYNMYVRTSGALSGTSNYDQWTKVSTLAVPNATAARYTLKYEVVTSAADDSDKRIIGIWLTPANGQEQEITVPVSGIRVALYGTSEYVDSAVNVDGKDADFSRIFGIGQTVVPDTANGEVAGVMNIYSFKYYASGANAAAVAGDASNEVDITVANDTGATMTANVVLAVYNGDTLVGFDGLTATETIDNGKSVTVTRTVANAVAGNTYKVMILNSKESLQPLTAAIGGTIN